jgi:hypothetical protein
VHLLGGWPGHAARGPKRLVGGARRHCIMCERDYCTIS